MHFNLASLLSISTALIAPFTLAGVAHPQMTEKMVMTNMTNNMNMNMNATNNTTSNMGTVNNMKLRDTMKIMPMAANETISLGHAIVVNRCEVPVYVWSVGQSISGQNTIQPGDGYVEIFRRDPKTGGIAIKITTVPGGLYSSAPQTVFAYNLVRDTVWYDLSDLFGDPFEGETVSLLPSEPAIRWEEGVPPSRSQVRMLEADTDLILNLC